MRSMSGFIYDIDGFYSKDPRDMYDWCDSCPRRTPQTHPYSYDAHYLWREFAKNERPSAVYSDRMREWDPDKYKEAFEGKGWIEALSPEQAKEAIRAYYDGKYVCTGYAICANQANGSPIGIFFIEDADVDTN